MSHLQSVAAQAQTTPTNSTDIELPFVAEVEALKQSLIDNNTSTFTTLAQYSKVQREVFHNIEECLIQARLSNDTTSTTVTATSSDATEIAVADVNESESAEEQAEAKQNASYKKLIPVVILFLATF